MSLVQQTNSENKSNDFLGRLVDLMEDTELSDFCTTYFKTWDETKTAIMIIKTYQVLDKFYIKPQNRMFNKSDLRSLLKKAITNGDFRDGMVKQMDLFMNNQVTIDQEIEKICNDLLLSETKLIKN